MKCACCDGDLGRVIYYTPRKTKAFCRRQCYTFYTERVRERPKRQVRLVRETPYQLGMAGYVTPSFRDVLLSRLVARGGR